MRINYTDEEDFPGQYGLWQANCRRSMQGKPGQRALRELEAALLALPTKQLIADVLEDEDGRVCAIGALAKAKSITPTADPGYEMEAVGVELGMPRLVAWEVVAQNDIELQEVWEVACGPLRQHVTPYDGGVLLVREVTPAERYEKMLAWVREQLQPTGPPTEVRLAEPSV